MRTPKVNVKRPHPAKYYAKQFGVTERTIRYHFAQDRAEWEANSITRAAPWKVMGISRTTWYRHGKPTPPQAQETTA